MALSANTIWEIRPGLGSANNGGGFVSGTGTDYTQQNGSQDNGINLTVDAVTNTDVAPDGYVPSAADVGNIINITTNAGGWTAGRYQIASIQAGKWRLDRSPAATTTAGGTWYLGGALASLATLTGTIIVAGNRVFIKATGTTDELTTTAVSIPSGTIVLPIKIEGYNTTRGDLMNENWNESHNPAGFLYADKATGIHTYPLITTTTGTLTTGTFVHLRCFSITGAPNSSLVSSNAQNSAYRLKIVNTGTDAASQGYGTVAKTILVDCDIFNSGSTSGYSVSSAVGAGYLLSCRIMCSANGGVSTQIGTFLNNCFLHAPTTGSAGIASTAAASQISINNCTFDSCYYGILYPDTINATTAVFSTINCLGTNCTVFAANLRAQLLTLLSFNNRLRDNGTNYSGWNTFPAPHEDITTDSSDSVEYTTLSTGFSTGGSTTTIQLASGSSSLDGYYVGCKIVLPDNSDSYGYVLSYDGATRTATMLNAFTGGVNASNKQYIIYTTYSTADSLARQAGIPNNDDIGWAQTAFPTNEEIAQAVWNYGERTLNQCSQ